MLKKYNYSTEQYPFRELFCDLIHQNYHNLESIHLLGGFENVKAIPGQDNNSIWHKRFYDNMRESAFMYVYERFIIEQIKAMFDEKLVYQRYPTVRFQIPGGLGVAAYHVDSAYNHPVNEINIWLPLTHAKESRTIWIESAPGKKDYAPQDVKYGEYIIFEGGKLEHGNQSNVTDQTRVSIDMRVIPASVYKPSDMKGIHYGKVRSTEGEDAYYSVK